MKPIDEKNACRAMNDTFPARLRYLREKRGMSRQVLGERCGLSKNMIGRYEKGEQIPNIDTLKNLCEVFGVSADYMLGKF